MLTGQCLGAISDRKQNSERYLAPLSMKVAEVGIHLNHRGQSHMELAGNL
jgi:hypothetical protein